MASFENDAFWVDFSLCCTVHCANLVDNGIILI